MSMGIVGNDDFEKEMNNLNVTVPIRNEKKVEIIDTTRGRGTGNNAVPDSLKKVIGETVVEEGRGAGREVARAFGISDSQVSAYSNGSHSTSSYDKPVDELKSHVNSAKIRIANKARHKLMQAINKITPEKLEETKARDLAGIAKDMSAVIKNMEPSNPLGEGGQSGPTFVIYAPQFRREETFDVIQVPE